MVYYGKPSCKNNYENYIEIIKYVFSSYKRESPLIVNTMGWVSGKPVEAHLAERRGSMSKLFASGSNAEPFLGDSLILCLRVAVLFSHRHVSLHFSATTAVSSSSQTKDFCFSLISSGCCLPAMLFSSVLAGANTCQTSPLTMWMTWTACTQRASPESETEVSNWQSLRRIWNLLTKKRRVQLCSLDINWYASSQTLHLEKLQEIGNETIMAGEWGSLQFNKAFCPQFLKRNKSSTTFQIFLTALCSWRRICYFLSCYCPNGNRDSPVLRWNDFEFFNFMMVLKQYICSRHCTLDFVLFLGNRNAIQHSVLMLGGDSDPQLPVSHLGEQ